MTVVVDANVTLALALPLPYSSHADRRVDEWRAERAIMAAPRLWDYEVTSGLRRALWRTGTRKTRYGTSRHHAGRTGPKDL